MTATSSGPLLVPDIISYGGSGIASAQKGVVVGNKRKDMVQEEIITAVREGANATGGFEFHIVEDHKDSKEAAETTGKDKTDDLLNQLEVPITNDNIKAVPRVSMLNFDIFTAGIETSTSTVKWEMSEMLKTPRVMTKAQAEVRQILSTKGIVVEETGLEELKLCHYTLPFICCFRKNAAKVVRLMDIRYLLSKPNQWSEAKRDS